MISKALISSIASASATAASIAFFTDLTDTCFTSRLHPSSKAPSGALTVTIVPSITLLRVFAGFVFPASSGSAVAASATAGSSTFVSSSVFGSSAAFSSAGVSTLLYVTSITFSSLIPATLYVITFPSVFAGSNALPFTLTCAISKPSFNVIWKLNSSPSLTSFTY